MGARIREWGKVGVVNLLLVIASLVVVEMAFGTWGADDAHCWHAILHHSYCPGVTHVTQLSSADGGKSISNHINRSLVRVPKRGLVDSTTDFSQYEVINIGDSFIEADELEYDQRLGKVMSQNSGFRVLDFGYSSWAPVIYHGWLNAQTLRQGVRVNVFVMVNDVTPDGGNTGLAYRKTALQCDSSGICQFHSGPYYQDTSLKALILRKSALIERLPRLWRGSRATLPDEQMHNPELAGDFSRPGDDCALLEAKRRAAPPREANYLTLDYLAYAFQPACWTPMQRKEVEIAAADLNAIVRLVHERFAGTVEVFLVPPGWAFSGENLVGKSAPAYRIAPETSITTLPLAVRLAELVHVPVISLETVIKSAKQSDPDLYYLPQDGHWNAHAHAFIGRWLAARL